ncbi:MAG: HAD family hydrolase [Clostridia bacterium]|nr:HAD family hydrolase [Clostridia bacterium]
MKKGVIFDLDGTLINSLPDISAAMNRSLAKFGLPGFEENAYKYKVGNGVFKIAERSVGERTELLEDVLHAYMEDYAQNCRVNSYAYKGVKDMLHGLIGQGLQVCVLSNKDQADTEAVLAYYFPGIAFAAIRGRVEGVPLKPDPAGALLIAQQLGLTSDEIWYVGDTSMDMNCGNAAGMETVGVLWGFRPREELVASGAKHLIANPQELLELTRI